MSYKATCDIDARLTCYHYPYFSNLRKLDTHFSKTAFYGRPNSEKGENTVC